MTVVLYYHELSDVESPLCVPPELFSTHLEVLFEARANVVTAAELADALAGGRPLPERTVALTFDDGFAAAVREAAPRLAATGFRATFFCVAGHLGGTNDWPTQPPGAAAAPLAGPAELRALLDDGHEIGAHGWSHAPLDGAADLERELVAAPAELEAAVGCEIRTYAYPYGASPTPAARALVERTYAGAFGTSAGRVDGSSPRWELPRIDAHYLRNPRLLRHVVEGSLDVYLGARRIGAKARRRLRKDYVTERTKEAHLVTTTIRR